MSTQPEALRLADELCLAEHGEYSWQVNFDAAAELCRQHAEIERLRDALQAIREMSTAALERKS